MLRLCITRERGLAALALGVSLGLAATFPLSAQAQPRSPEDFLGQSVGADRVLFDWDAIVGYLRHVDAESDRVDIEQLGESTEGRPFLLVKIADEEGVRSQDEVRATTRALYDARNTTEEAAQAIAADGRAVIAFSLGVHSTEVGQSQAAMEIVYRLATRDDAITRRIRERLMVLLIPSMNPDGLDLVNQWYMQTVGTSAEGTRPLELYHPYAGHDNNRDGFFNNLVETAMWSKVLYHDWLPQVVIDEHQMGSSGPRLFLPPFDDPLSPSVHPLVYSQLAAAGQQVVSDLTAQGWTGIATQTIFTAEWPGSVRSTGFWHNMLGILSEVASARLATPLYFPEGSLSGSGRGLPEYERRTNFLEPWTGGWWRLRDIVDIDIDLTWGFLRWASERKEDLLLNFWRMNRDAIEAGREQAPFAYVVPTDQLDQGSDDRLAEILHSGGVELHRATEALRFGDHVAPAGSWVVRSDQPFRPFVTEMLGTVDYPMIRQGGADGAVIRPYDVTAWRLSELLGVRVLEVNDRDALDGFALQSARPVRVDAVIEEDGVMLSSADLASHTVVNLALHNGGRVTRASFTPSEPVQDFYVQAPAERLGDWMARAGARPHRVRGDDSVLARETMTAPRLAIYSPWGGSMDEGWTRLVLDRYGFDYRRFRPGIPDLDDPSDGRQLLRDTDVVLLPSISKSTLENGVQSAGKPRVFEAAWDEEYRRGLGGSSAGTALMAFVEGGGTVIALNHSAPWVVDHLGLPVRVELEDAPRDRFYAPGTLVRGVLDRRHPLAAGMGETASLYFARGYAFAPVAWPEPTAVVVRYAPRDVLVAGFLTGGELLEGRPAMVEIPVGKGRVILFGFSPQRRAQTEGTFKLLFNAIWRGTRPLAGR